MYRLGEIINYSTKGVKYQRVNKTTARKQFDAGKTIVLLPSNTSFFSVWVSPMWFNNTDTNNFEYIINSYVYYNCNSELGKRVHYFVEVE